MQNTSNCQRNGDSNFFQNSQMAGNPGLNNILNLVLIQFFRCLSQTQARDQKRDQVTFQLNFPGDREEPGNKVIQRNKSEIISCRRRNLKDAEC